MSTANLKYEDSKAIEHVSRNVLESGSAIAMAKHGPLIDGSTAIRLGKIQALHDFKTSLPFIVLDTFAATLSLLVANWVFLTITGVMFAPGMPAVLVVVLGTLAIQHVHGLYPACGLSYSLEFRRILRTCVVLTVGMAIGVLLNSTAPALIGIMLFALMLAGSIAALRPLARHLFGKFDWWAQPVIVIGSTSEAVALHANLDKRRIEGVRSVGVLFVPDQEWMQSSEKKDAVFIGSVHDLAEVMLRVRASRIAVAEAVQGHWASFETYHGAPHVALPAKISRQPTEKAVLDERGGQVVANCHHAVHSPSARFAKRLMDLSIVIALAPFWLPVFTAISLLIKVTSPGPIFYKQKRVGRHGKPFAALKFRSMDVDADQKLKSYLTEHPELQAEWDMTHKLKNDPRVSGIGGFLRKSSLDELPQLLNVLFGEMSLVGPRPIIDCDNYDREYIEDHSKVFELYKMVRPGITGLWQVSGRNHTSYDERVLYDRIYLQNWSIMQDIFILWRTLKTAILREGAY